MIPCRGHGRRRPISWCFGLLGLSMVAVVLPVRAQDAANEPLSLATVLELAGSGSRAATAASTDIGLAEAAVHRAKAGWWPSLDLRAQYLVRDNPIEARFGAFTVPTAEKASGQYELSVRELLYDGGRRGLAVTMADREVDATRSAGVADVQQAQLAAMDAYLAALELGGQRGVLEQRLTALAAHRKVVDDLYEHGLTARNDVLATEVRVREVQDQIQAVQNHRQVAERDLNRQLGRDPETVSILPDSLPAPPRLPDDRDAFLAAAPEANASVRAAADRLDATQAALTLARRLWVPSFFVGASHGYQDNRYLVYQFMNMVTAGVTWNIFDGGARDADVQQARARLTAAQRDHVELQRVVAVAADAAWLAWNQAQREEATAQANVVAAQENLRIVSDQYRSGVARSSDVLEAEALLAASRFDVVARHYDTYRAQAQLLVAAGRDLVEFYGAASGAAQER